MNIYLFTVLVAILLFAFVIIVQSIIDYLKK